MSGMNFAEPPRTEIRMSIPKFLTVIPVLKIYDMMGNMQCKTYLSDDDCDENEKFELPKITKLPSFTEYQKGLSKNIRKGFSKKSYPQKRSEVSLKNVRRF